MAINPLQSAAVGWPNVVGAAKSAAAATPSSFRQLFDRARSASHNNADAAHKEGSDVVVEGTAVPPLTKTSTLQPAVLQQDAQRLLGSLKSNLSKSLADAGVTVPPGVEIVVDPSGEARVVGDHPDRDKIEEMLREQPALVEQIGGVASAFRALRTAELGPAAADPLFGPNFRLLLDGDSLQTSFV